MAHSVFEVKRHATVSTICIPSLYRLIPSELKNLISNDESNSFSLGYALESFRPLLEMVFEYLDRNDLENVKLVNSVWNVAANRELQKRIWPSWLEFCTDPMCLRVSPGFTDNNVAVGILAFNAQYIKYPVKVCVHGSSDCTNMSFSNYVKDELMYNNFDYLTLKCVITCNRECSRNLCTLTGCYCKSAFQCILLPKIPKINISLIYYHASTSNFSKLIKPNEIIRCALVFTQYSTVQYSRDKVLNAFCRKLLFGQPTKSLALGGGIISQAKAVFNNMLPKVLKSKEDFVCITFSQEQGVEAKFGAYSQLFIETPDKFEADVLKFKSEIVLRNHGIVFRFCGCGKEDGIYETDIITKHFPNFQILGLEVDGELGWNYSGDENSSTRLVLSDEKTNDTAKLPLGKKKKMVDIEKRLILHSDSTVLVLITWGHKIR